MEKTIRRLGLKLIRASSEHSQQLLEYFRSTPFPGSVELRVEREKDFFAPYRWLTDDAQTYILFNDNQGIEAVATLLFRQSEVLGTPQVVGYATDLRVSNSRQAVMGWAQHFLPVLEQERQKRECRYVFSVLFDSQKQAYNALVRPRLAKRNLPSYLLVRKFDVHSLHGVFPWAPQPIMSVVVREADERLLPRVAEYVCERAKRSPIRFSLSPEGVLAAWRRLPGFRSDHIFAALDIDGQVVGSALALPNEDIHRVWIEDLSDRAMILRDTLRFLSLLRIAKPLASKRTPLKYFYLVNLEANNPDVFYSLLHAIYHRVPNKEFVVFTQYENDLLKRRPRTFISARRSGGLYVLVPPGEDMPEFIVSSHNDRAPELEMPFL